MRDHSQHIQVSKETAVSTILANCSFNRQQETIPLENAIGRVLAEDAVSRWESPNCLTCRMDSVAVHWDDFAQGMPDTSAWERGKQWEFANTGVAMPQGFDTAIVVEHVIFSENDTRVAFDAMPGGRYAGTSAPGSKLKKGDLLVPAGTVITPLLAAHIRSGSNTAVSVVKKPRVVFIPTGNELIPAREEIPVGRNIESNSIMIAGKIRAWGGEPVIYDIVPDDREAIRQALLRAAAEADIVILNAGSSKGNDDWGIEMLEELGTVFYHQTNHGPGHHSSFGVLDGVPVIGISGPPGGAAFTTDYYVYPAVRQYLGLSPALRRISVRLAGSLGGHGKPGKSEQPAKADGAAKPEKTEAPVKAEYIDDAGKAEKPEKPEKHGPEQTGRAANGSVRPKEGGEFYTVKQLCLRWSQSGLPEAVPTSSSHPDPLEAEQAAAYYLMSSWSGKPVPQVGDIIEVELRPEFGLGLQ